MKKLTIIIIEDEPEVRNAILRDLAFFQHYFDVEESEDTEDAAQLIQSLQEDHREIALFICDHVMPGKDGVSYLTELNQSPELYQTRKILLTGHAGHEDTIKAINEAQINHYITKPWEPEALCSVVKHQLTQYVIQTQDNLLPYVSILESEPLLQAIANQ